MFFTESWIFIENLFSHNYIFRFFTIFPSFAEYHITPVNDERNIHNFVILCKWTVFYDFINICNVLLFILKIIRIINKLNENILIHLYWHKISYPIIFCMKDSSQPFVIRENYVNKFCF